MKIYYVIIGLLLSSISCSSQSIDDEKKELLSTVSLPQEVRPVETTEEWYPNGDGYYLSRFSLKDDEVYYHVVDELKLDHNNLRSLPFGDEILDNLIFEYVDDNDEGYYSLIHNKNDQRDIKMIVLNDTKRELIFFISYQ